MRTIRTAAALVAFAMLSHASPAPAEERRAAPHAPPRHATEGEPYVFGQLGLFNPGGNDDGFYLGGGVGSRVTDLVAIDLGLSTYRTADHGSDVNVWPLLAGVRLILPNPVVEPYVGIAAGFFFTDVEHAGSDTTFGGAVSGGVDAWLSPTVALNGELRYHFADPEVDGHAVDVDGPSFVLGVRVGL